MRLQQTIQRKINRITQRWAIGKVGAVLLAIPAVCLAFVLIVVVDLRRDEQQVEHSIQMIQKRNKTSELILRYMIDRETGIRGYLLTQDEQFLQPYKETQQTLYPALARLRQQSPSEDKMLQKLEQQIQQRIQIGEQLLKVAESIDRASTSPFSIPSKGGLTPVAIQQLREQLNQSKQGTDLIRQTIINFQQQQEAFLVNQNAQLNQGKKFVDRIQLLGALLSVLSYIVVVILFQSLDRSMVQRDREIKQGQATITTLSNNLVDGVLMLDRQGLIESLNPAAERILGQTASASVGRALLDVLFSNGLPITLDPIELSETSSYVKPINPLAMAATWVQAKAETGAIEQLITQQADGQQIPIELSISYSASSVPKFIVIIRDVSERVNLAQSLSDKVLELGILNQNLATINSALQQKTQSLEIFVRTAAHDLKTPIRGIAALAQWLEADLREGLTAENQNSLKLLNQRVMRMQAITDGLLNYANIEIWITRQAIVDTRVLVQGVCQQISVPTAFSVTISGDMPTLKTQHIALKFVFEQLIRNAIDHHDQGQGTIEILGTAKADCIEFVVRDDGPGIALVYRDRVLQMFQVLNHKPNVSENVGVGLALVHRTIQLVGGNLNLKASTKLASGEERGLEVYFTWPLLE